MHPTEERLRDLYVAFAKGDLDGFLAGCTHDVTFTVPGNTLGSGTFIWDEFTDWIVGVLGRTFREYVLDVFANDEHGLMVPHHEFDREGVHREHRTARILGLRGGLTSKWTEHPGSVREFEAAWGTR